MLQMQYLGNDTFPMLEVDVEDNEVKGFTVLPAKSDSDIMFVYKVIKE